MTMSCDKFGSGIFKVLYFMAKLLGLVAFHYDFRKKVFLTTIPATVMSMAICTFVAVMSPIVHKLSLDLFLISDVGVDEQMSIIIGFQFAFDFATSFVVVFCQLWKREHVIRSANNFQKVLHQLTTEMHCGTIITPGIILLIAMKFSITMYEVLINFPYLIQYSDIITGYRFVAFFFKLYIGVIASVFSDMTFVALLLLARYFYLVNELLETLKVDIQTGRVYREKIHQQRRRLLRLIRLYQRLRRMVAQFSKNFEISIFAQILNSFANVLVNLYALLGFYAIEKNLEMKSLIYNVVIFFNICLLIHAAEKVKRRSAELKDTLLDMDASRGECPSEWSSDALVLKTRPEVSEVNVLGMFSLNNMFMLFLFIYATDFVVLILQFQLTAFS